MSWHKYGVLAKFLVPLALTAVAQDIAEQALNRSLVSSTAAVIDLASFGIAYKLLQLFTGSIEDFKYVSVILMHCQKDRRKIILTAAIFSVIALTLMLIIGFTDAGDIIINDLHDVQADVAIKARKLLYLFALYPFLDSLAWIHTGILMQYKYSFVCGVASVVDVFCQVIMVTVLLQTSLATDHVIYIPLLAAYTGCIGRLIVVLCSYYKYIHKQLQQDLQEGDQELEIIKTPVTVKKILQIWAPLMAFRVCQRVLRPLINLFVARDDSSEILHCIKCDIPQDEGTSQNVDVKVQALAALAICFPLSQIPYRWLDELKVLEATFVNKKDNQEKPIKSKDIYVFGFIEFCIASTISIVMFLIPGVSSLILIHILGVNDEELVKLCIQPLQIFSLIPLPVIIRTLSTGWLLRMKATSALYPSVIGKLVTGIIMLNVLPTAGLHGASMGATSLVIAALLEPILVVIAAIFVKKVLVRASKQNNRDLG